MFRRRRREPPDGVYSELREKLLRLDPVDAGLTPTAELPRVYGLMLEMGMAEGCATLVALADGTTSFYTSTGGGVIGGGEHERVRAASAHLLGGLELELDRISPSSDEALPRPGRVVIRALTYDGPRVAEASEDELAEQRHQLWRLFHAGHAVITELRLA